MALYLGSNNITAKRTGVTVNVPNNEVARLMYYLECVCTTINCNDDLDIQRFTKYTNWASLSVEDQTILVALCCTFSPDVFDNRVFFQSDELCGNSTNEFYTINQVSNHIIAAESIVIADQERQVNKIMTYKMQWMQANYINPLQRLVARLKRPSAPPPITYTAPTNRRSHYTPPVLQPPAPRPRRSNFRCKCCSIFIILLIIIIGVGVGIYFILKQRGII